MKKNIKISLITGSLIFLTAAIVYAATTTVPEKNTAPTVSEASISKSSELLNILDSNSSNLKTSVKYDELQDKTLYEIGNVKYFIDMDTNNNLVGIYSKSLSTAQETSTLNNDQAKEYILNKYNELNLPKEYELNYVEKYDDLIWQANFEKNYDGIYNKYESVKVFFIPDTDEIVALTVFNEPAKSSEISVSEEEATLTAAEKLDLSTDEIVSAELTMEKSNTFYDESNSNSSIHSTWVITASDNSIIYIDAETNEVIGGDSINE